MGVYIAGADPASEDPELKIALQRAGFVIVQDLFLTETAKLADVVLPAQAIMEREGTIVSGERRMQYYTPAVTAPEGTQADHVITRAIAARNPVRCVPPSACGMLLVKHNTCST